MIRSGKVGVRSCGEYDYIVYWLVCDKCHKEFGEDDEIANFNGAVRLKKALGFKSFRKNGRWYEYCPQCAREMEKKNED